MCNSCAVGSTSYFIAERRARKSCKSDVTVAGTVLVKEIAGARFGRTS